MPLAKQAVAILRELHALTGQGRFVFPGARSNLRTMSEAAINAALRRLGYDARGDYRPRLSDDGSYDSARGT
ncbi:hypothetical protein EOS_05785 [Caballeronia mineralivorans PML1(12)]|uniref:Integrase n=1 Tax=Caballeronia mineralivorans PML1(12) TaxID=908627 RepID=A0A0J1D394_9BURK|nr:hypothetical protein EOS_05785 [Caballeronia mineralivorans PML1(12)]